MDVGIQYSSGGDRGVTGLHRFNVLNERCRFVPTLRFSRPRRASGSSYTLAMRYYGDCYFFRTRVYGRVNGSRVSSYQERKGLWNVTVIPGLRYLALQPV